LLQPQHFCTAIASARIYTLLREAQLFPASASGVRDGTALQSYVAAFVAPLARFRGRNPFIGIGVGAAAVCAVLWLRRLPNSHLRGCATAFIASIGLNVVPRELAGGILPGLSPWMFRDSMLFFGLLAGGWVLQRALRGPQLAYRYGAILLVLLQVVQQWHVATKPSLIEPPRRAYKLQFYRYQGHPFGLGRVLVDEANRFGPRIICRRSSTTCSMETCLPTVFIFRPTWFCSDSAPSMGGSRMFQSL
jgi:hypothetical protein